VLTLLLPKSSVTGTVKRAGSRVTERTAVCVVFVAAMFMNGMDITIVNVAVPTIGVQLGIPPAAVDGVSISYLVALAAVIPAAGWLGDRFGAKRILLGAIIMFAAASALCGLATGLDELIAFRALQGMAGGMLAPVGMAMLFRAFTAPERVKVSSILTIPTTLGPALGPVLGGILVTDVSWRWIFYGNVPIALAAFTFGLFFLPGQPRSPTGRFDVPGLVSGGVGLGLLIYGVSEAPDHGWQAASVVTTCLLGAASLGLMVVVELRVREPMVRLRLLANRLFRACNLVIVSASGAFIGTLFLVSLYYQDGRGLSPLTSGLSTFPEAFGVMTGSQFAARIVYPVLGPRRHICCGLLATAAVMASFAGLDSGTSLWVARALMFTLGFSLAQVIVPTQAAAFASIPHHELGHASTMFNALRQLSGAVCVALFTTTIVLAGGTGTVGVHAAHNIAPYRAAFCVAAVVCLLGLASAVRIRDGEAANTIPGRVRRSRSSMGT
jgi:EmrB/QacA subfamily drug resistance transporter